MEKAREFFVNSIDEDVPPKQPVVLRLLGSISADADKFKDEEGRLPPDDGEFPLRVEKILPTALFYLILYLDYR